MAVYLVLERHLMRFVCAVAIVSSTAFFAAAVFSALWLPKIF
jgi:multisubunit Na+/H+ antiporter MnhC subunit